MTSSKPTSFHPDCVIFDMDGLIFDSERQFFKHLKEVAATFGYSITEENYKKTLGLTGHTLKQTMLSLYGESYPLEEINRITREHMIAQVKKSGLPIKEGIVDLLNKLKQLNISCGVASSTRSSFVQIYLETTGIDSFFSVIVGGNMVSRSKPEPDIFLKACELLRGTTAHALVLEDSENGILAAHRAGMKVICIPDMKYPDLEYEKLAYTVVKNAHEVCNWIR